MDGLKRGSKAAPHDVARVVADAGRLKRGLIWARTKTGSAGDHGARLWMNSWASVQARNPPVPREPEHHAPNKTIGTAPDPHG
jgi:hypothetical protein